MTTKYILISARSEWEFQSLLDQATDYWVEQRGYAVAREYFSTTQVIGAVGWTVTTYAVLLRLERDVTDADTDA